MRAFASTLAIAVFATGSAYAQYVISAHSGVVQYVQGRALLNDNAVDPKFGQFPEIKENQIFHTEEGRAEVLLTPGVFLRMAENSSIRMVSNRLTDTRVEVLNGSVMVECDEALKDQAKDNAITLLYKGDTMLLLKHGLYRVDTDPARFRVYDGEAIVKGESGQLTLKSGKQTALGGVLMAENFDKKLTDDLYLWSSQRSGYLAKANVSSAMGLRNSGYGRSFSGWQWNSLFGLYTWVPYRGGFYSPFGFYFWSPYTVGNYYYYNPGYYSGGGGGGPRSPSVSAFSGYASEGRAAGWSGPSGSVVSVGSSGGAGGGVASGGVAGGGGGHVGGGGGGGGVVSSGGGGGASGGRAH